MIQPTSETNWFRSRLTSTCGYFEVWRIWAVTDEDIGLIRNLVRFSVRWARARSGADDYR